MSSVAGRREIGAGVLVLVGVAPRDEPGTAQRAAAKIAQLRIFEDSLGRTNLSLEETRGAALVVSQFTLLADVSRGRRPGFGGAAGPAHAEAIYEQLLAALRGLGVPVEVGWFGAAMDVELVNHGPFTLAIDTETLPL